TWSLVPGPLSSWAEGARPYFITSTQWLLACHEGLFLTLDKGGTWKKVAGSGGFAGLYQSMGVYYMPSDQGVLRSDDGLSWTLLEGSPVSSTLIGTGKTLYAGNIFSSGPDVLSSAPESDPTHWTKVSTPVMAGNG